MQERFLQTSSEERERLGKILERNFPKAFQELLILTYATDFFAITPAEKSVFLFQQKNDWSGTHTMVADFLILPLLGGVLGIRKSIRQKDCSDVAAIS